MIIEPLCDEPLCDMIALTHGALLWGIVKMVLTINVSTKYGYTFCQALPILYQSDRVGIWHIVRSEL